MVGNRSLGRQVALACSLPVNIINYLLVQRAAPAHSIGHCDSSQYLSIGGSSSEVSRNSGDSRNNSGFPPRHGCDAMLTSPPPWTRIGKGESSAGRRGGGSGQKFETVVGH
jgi:hypothetical protein